MASEIKVDTISEKTSAGGVTIDGLTIKDGNINESFSIVGTTPSLTLGDAGAEDIKVVFDGNAQDFHIGLDDSADDLVIGVGSTLGTTTAVAIDENAGTTFSGTVTVGEDDTGKDVKFFGASAGAYMEWDESADQLRIMGASADATTSTGKLLLATSLTDINANDVIGKIEFQAPHEAGGTDAITVAASIQAVAQSTFSASSNATDLVFNTGHSEAAAEKFRFTSQNEIGIAGANYGTDGQVLTSGGAGAAVAWEDAGGFDVSSITGATALAEEPALTDEMVLSDAGTLKRLDMTHIYAQPACLVGGWGTTSLYPGNNAVTLVDWATEAYDEGGCFNNTNSSTTLNGLTAPAYSFTPNVPGVYQVIVNIYWAGEGVDGEADKYVSVHFRINGSHYTKIPGIQPNQEFGMAGIEDTNVQGPPAVFNIPMNGTGDYMQWYAYNLTGEAPELNFDYSSVSVTRIAGLKTTSRP